MVSHVRPAISLGLRELAQGIHGSVSYAVLQVLGKLVCSCIMQG